MPLATTVVFPPGSVTSQVVLTGTVTVIVNLPYLKCVNRLENRSKNAIRCDRYRRKRQEEIGENL